MEGCKESDGYRTTLMVVMKDPTVVTLAVDFFSLCDIDLLLMSTAGRCEMCVA